jgi:biopolymer transport protein ExbD
MRVRKRPHEEPEINLIPFIDVLLVIVIFLMLSTTYAKFTELQITLPTADTQAQRDYPKEVVVAVSGDGRYVVNGTAVAGRSVEEVALALTNVPKLGKETVVIIHADANAAHQTVITVMEAARRSGLSQITFVAQTTDSASVP